MLAACMKNTDNETIYCDPAESNTAFQVLDKNSGEDLFFGSASKFKPKDLKIYPLRYKNDSDTLRVRPFTTPAAQIFVFPFNFNKDRDTVLIKIADTRPDTLIYTVKKPSNACAPYSIGQAYFNSNEIIKDNGLLIFKK